MAKLIWNLIESEIEAYVTRRIVMFHEALVKRGQISPIVVEDPTEELAS